MAKKHHLYLAKKIHKEIVWTVINNKQMSKNDLYVNFYKKYNDELAGDTIYSYFNQSIRKLKKLGLKEKDGIFYFKRSHRMNEKEFLKQLKSDLKKTIYTTTIPRNILFEQSVFQLNLISKKEFKRIYEELISQNKIISLEQIDAYRIW